MLAKMCMDSHLTRLWQGLQTDPPDEIKPPQPMTDDEWDAIYLYAAVVFRKRGDPNQFYPNPPSYQGRHTPQPHENDIVYIQWVNHFDEYNSENDVTFISNITQQARPTSH